ncbi:NAD(P)H-hydrate dehydratase [Sphingomonas sp.]|uniref:NAD(P)H-hydrate dehydratase n=1 Tax=Sphingomonas sp. TaxID=28214 RepID=UPI002FC75F7E
MGRRFILTADEIRAAEEAVIAAGTSGEELMARAGAAAADAIWRYAGPRPALVLCGPGNNGGDGYVIARLLAARGVAVRVAALAEPRTTIARWARAGWTGDVEDLLTTHGAPLLIDALFGIGLVRPLDPDAAAALMRLASEAQVIVAIDLPSGAATDDGSLLSPVPDYDLTIAFAALKPSHLLQPAARHIGRLVLADIGVPAQSQLHAIGRPSLRLPGPDDHKYSRGYVAVLAGAMAGAAGLTASAALRAGAGYVRLIGGGDVPVPLAVVRDHGSGDPLEDQRIGAIAIGPGLGRDTAAERLLEQALASRAPLVLDADALVLLARRADMPQRAADSILTPHAGEFAQLFGTPPGTKIDQARAAARGTGAVVVFKGADTVVAAPDGRAAIAPPAPAALASAGTGDVLTGIIAALRAGGLEAYEAACAGVWLHGRAAELAGDALIADDLVSAIPMALAQAR